MKRGFTLVELLVVVLILALAAGAVALTVPTDSGAVRAEASRLAARIAALRDQSILEGRPLGVVVDGSGFSFEARGPGSWTPMAGQFQRVTFDDGVTAALGDGEAARLRFDTVGMPGAPARFVLVEGDHRASVEVAANGDVSTR